MIPILFAVIYFGFFSVLFGTISIRKQRKAAAGDGGSGKSFFTASGQIGWIAFMCAFTLAPLGGGHTTALIEQQFGMGAAVAWWGILGGGVFVPIFLLFIAPWFRKLNSRYGIVTFPQATEKLFGSKMKIVNTSLSPAGWLGITMSELLGTATCIYALTAGRLPFAPWCVIIAGCLMLIYVLFGGILQASYMGVINAIVLIVGAYIAVSVAIHNVQDGSAGVYAALAASGNEWHTSIFHLTPVVLMNVAIPMIVQHVLSVSSEQCMYQPVMAVKDNYSMRRGALIGGLLNTSACLPFVILSVIAQSIPEIAADTPLLAVSNLALTALPQIMIGLLIVSLLAALLSTGSGMLLATSQVIIDDLICPIVNKKPGDKGYLAISRGCIIILLLACLLPAMKVSLLITLFMWCFAISMPIMVNYMFGMCWRINRKAAWITVIVSTAVNFWWTFACPPWAGMFTLPFWPVAFVSLGLGAILLAVMPGWEKGLLRQIKDMEKAEKEELVALKAKMNA